MRINIPHHLCSFETQNCIVVAVGGKMLQLKVKAFKGTDSDSLLHYTFSTLV